VEVVETEELTTYNVKVVVEFNYEVEASSVEEATEQGWLWYEPHRYGEVYSINVDEVIDYDDEDEEG
jgi:hypothetical protein